MCKRPIENPANHCHVLYEACQKLKHCPFLSTGQFLYLVNILNNSRMHCPVPIPLGILSGKNDEAGLASTGRASKDCKLSTLQPLSVPSVFMSKHSQIQWIPAIKKLI